jgi:glycosyltransferase involved in cell wall biosynthesis
MNLFTFSILDVRTGDTHFNGRFSIFNSKILITSMFFKKVTVISKELQRLLYLPTRKCHILPLGGEPMKISHKNTETLNLLYIGTLVDRNIHLTISGISIFCKEYPDVAVNYEIVGDGRAKDVNLLLEYINLYNLNDIIKYHGYKDHDQAKELFEKANLGIVFIPLNKGYLYQPSTKLYEFLIVGIPVIATRTIDNLNRVTEKEGIIIDDNPESFAKGLGIFYSKKNNYDIESIKNEFREFSWEKIVKNNLEPYFESMINYN